MSVHISLEKSVLETSTPPSIFNDVFGPVMIGPSSSHSGAAFRIGKLCLDLLDGTITYLHARYNRETALAKTHIGQGTNRGLYGAILGWDMVDPRMEAYDEQIEECLREAGIAVTVEYPDLGSTHASFYHLTVGNDREEHRVEAISTGGGMFKILRIDGTRVAMEGDFYELLVYCNRNADALGTHLACATEAEFVLLCSDGPVPFFQVKSASPFDEGFLRQLGNRDGVTAVKALAPVLPTLSRENVQLPFLCASDMLKYNRAHGLSLWQLALRYESARGGVSERAVWTQMEEIVAIMRRTLDAGLAGTDYADRLQGGQAPLAADAVRRGAVPDDFVAKMILYTAAFMDAKSAMKVFVAAPTAGSCATTPGAILAIADARQSSDEEIVQAMLAAGMIGVFIAAHATFSAELAGCMAETGASGAMAAAGLVHLLGGDLDQALTAAGTTINTGLGLICDMLADRVEAPCMDKNIAAALRAYGSAIAALMGFSKVIPFDESVRAMREIGQLMPDSMCCTGGAGLCQTPTGQRLHRQLVSLDIGDRPPGSLLISSHEIEG